MFSRIRCPLLDQVENLSISELGDTKESIRNKITEAVDRGIRVGAGSEDYQGYRQRSAASIGQEVWQFGQICDEKVKTWDPKTVSKLIRQRSYDMIKLGRDISFMTETHGFLFPGLDPRTPESVENYLKANSDLKDMGLTKECDIVQTVL